jgi:sec-independent protein translocase protein TatC
MTLQSQPMPGSSRATFFQHLEELRKRLIYVTVVGVLVACVCYNYAPLIFEWLRQPLAAVSTQKMAVLDQLEMFSTYIKLSLIAAMFVTAPWAFLQLWLFVSPGLYPHEKKWVLPFVFLGTVFFVSGAAFAYYIVLPNVFKFLVMMLPASVEAHYSVSNYFSLVMQLLLAFSCIFELPLVMWILALAGFFSPDTYARFRRYWLLISAVLGGILTPTPDPLTQIMMAAPLVLFFEVGILGSRLLVRKRTQSQETSLKPHPRASVH